MENQFDICVLGSANRDLYLPVPHFPVEGETIQASKSFYKNGGKGANTAVASARLLARSCFAGQVGQEYDETEMKESGLNLDHLKRLSEVVTGLALIMINEVGENSIVIVGNANTFYKNLEYLPLEYEKAINSSSIVLLQREIPQQINILAAQLAKNLNKVVALDCGGRDEPYNKEFLQNLEFVSPNETELLRMIEEDQVDVHNIREIIEKNLLKKYPSMKVLLKLGKNGSRLITKELDISMQAVTQLNPCILNDLKIVDTTGAGDCFTASFFVKYNELIIKKNRRFLDEKELEKDYKKCMLFASAAAFCCITSMGAMPSQPSRKSVNDFLEKYFPDFDQY